MDLCHCIVSSKKKHINVNAIEFLFITTSERSTHLKSITFSTIVAVKGAGISEFDSSDDSQQGRIHNQHQMSIYQSQPNQHNQQMMYGQGNRQSQHGMQQISSQHQQQQHNQHCEDSEPEFRVRFSFTFSNRIAF